MQALFPVYPFDQMRYRDQIAPLLPRQILDIHTHVWKKSIARPERMKGQGNVSWTAYVADDQSMEDLLWTYQALFPDKQVIPLIFGFPDLQYDTEDQNSAVCQTALKHGFPALALVQPEWSAKKLEWILTQGGFFGCKVYLSYSPSYIPEHEIRIFDFLPRHQLEVIDQLGLLVMLHIPRDQRLRDEVNIAQLLEINRCYPRIKVIVAHVGRAYCEEDVGQSLERLAASDLFFDISANTNCQVFEQLIKAVGPKRILFGSDLPITRMRSIRVCENGHYINIVPKGLYGDISHDNHMREADPDSEKEITIFLYEEISAILKAGKRAGLSEKDFHDIFFQNAVSLLSLDIGAVIRSEE